MHISAAPLILSLSLLQHARSRPTHPAFISIPLHPVPSSSRTTFHLPPTIVHQQHANRGIQRLNLMSGSPIMPDSQLLANLQKRASVLSPHLRNRYSDDKSTDVLARLMGTLSLDYKNYSTSSEILRTSESGNRKPTSNHTIPLSIESYDIGYFGKVQIGTPPTYFNILMDSGSADFWVGSVNCSAEGGSCGNHPFLGLAESSTLNVTEDQWETDYGTGTVWGNLVSDDVTIAGLKLQSYRFGVATFESEDFTLAPFDGLAGLAKSKISRQQTIPLVEACRQQGLIKHAIVSYKIPRLADDKHDGEMTLGGLNPARYDPETVVTVPNVNDHGFWEAEIGAFLVNNINMGWENRTAIVDTGTTLVIAPQQDVDAIHEIIPGAVFDGGAWTVPCTVNASFSLVIGGREFSVDARDLAFLPIDPEKPAGKCTSGFSAQTFGRDTQWLVGDVFLKNVYMSTNVDTDKISFAKLAG